MLCVYKLSGMFPCHQIRKELTRYGNLLELVNSFKMLRIIMDTLIKYLLRRNLFLHNMSPMVDHLFQLVGIKGIICRHIAVPDSMFPTYDIDQ